MNKQYLHKLIAASCIFFLAPTIAMDPRAMNGEELSEYVKNQDEMNPAHLKRLIKKQPFKNQYRKEEAERLERNISNASMVYWAKKDLKKQNKRDKKIYNEQRWGWLQDEK